LPAPGGRQDGELQLEAVLHVGRRDRGRAVGPDLDVDRGQVFPLRPLDQDGLERGEAVQQHVAPDLDVPAERVALARVVDVLLPPTH
jgi:hypothetical protein